LGDPGEWRRWIFASHLWAERGDVGCFETRHDRDLFHGGMARGRLDFVPADLAQLSAFWKHLRRRKHSGSDVDHGARAFLADSDSVLLHGDTGGDRASVGFYVVDRGFHAFDRAT